MKATNRCAVTCGLLLIAATATGQTPDQKRIFASTYCIKVAAGKGSEFEQFMKEAGRKLAEARLSMKRIAGMSLSRAVAPLGEQAMCSYVLVYTYEGGPPVPENLMEEELKKGGANLTARDYLARRDSLSKLVSHARYVRYAGFGQAQNGDYWQVNFMKPRPGKQTEFYDYEAKTYMPLAREAAERGHPRKAWSGWHMLYPSGTGLDYAGVTVDVFRDWDSIWKPQSFSKAIVDKVFPGKSLEELLKPVSELRDLVRRELYVQIDGVSVAAR